MFLSNQSYKFKKMNLQIVIKAVASKGLYHGIIIDNYKMRFNAFYIVCLLHKLAKKAGVDHCRSEDRS